MNVSNGKQIEPNVRWIKGCSEIIGWFVICAISYHGLPYEQNQYAYYLKISSLTCKQSKISTNPADFVRETHAWNL